MYNKINGRRACCAISADANIVTAGGACMEACADTGLESCYGAPLAQVQFPIQEYQLGFCPCAALEAGTLFPELVQ